jgi:hypothetical protein
MSETEQSLFSRVVMPVRASETFPAFRYRNKRARESGVALQGHTQHQHGGKIVATCPACIELSKEVKRK